MREVEAEFPLANIDPDQAVGEISRRFKLPQQRRGLTHVRDTYLDTNSYRLLKRGSSFRLRHKLDNIYSGEGTRLTFKYPLEEHPELLIREEVKLKVAAVQFDEVREFTDGMAYALLKERVFIHLAAEEMSTEVYLGEGGELLNLSFDRVKFKNPADQRRTHSVSYLELEDHGIGMDALLEITSFVEEYFAIAASTETKYRYGLRVLSLRPEAQAPKG